MTRAGQISVAAHAPALPPCGVYRFYWVEEAPGVRGSLLSAQPIDPEESAEWYDSTEDRSAWETRDPA